MAIGFMQSFFGLRFASSYKAILDTLTRRREKVAVALEHRLALAETTEEDWEELLDNDSDEPGDELAAAGLRSRSDADLRWEFEKLAELIDRLVPLVQKPSPKVRTLLTLLQQRRLPGGRIRQMVSAITGIDGLICRLVDGGGCSWGPSRRM